MGTILRCGGHTKEAAYANLDRLYEVLSTGQRVAWLPGLSFQELQTIRDLNGQIIGTELTGVTVTDLTTEGAYPADLSAIKATDLWLAMGRIQ